MAFFTAVLATPTTLFISPRVGTLGWRGGDTGPVARHKTHLQSTSMIIPLKIPCYVPSRSNTAPRFTGFGLLLHHTPPNIYWMVLVLVHCSENVIDILSQQITI